MDAPSPESSNGEAVATSVRVGLLGVTVAGQVFFAPNQHPFALEVVIAETGAALMDACEGNGAADACCIYDYDCKGPMMGKLVFGRRKLTRALVVHEVVHAAIAFAHDRILRSKQCKKMKPAERNEYIEEAIARLSENLFEQVETLVWPNMDSPA